MDHVLPWFGLVLGLLSTAYAILRSAQSRPDTDLRLPAAVTVTVLVIGALATFPTGGPWSPGQTLWPGLLLGGLVILISDFVSAREESLTDVAALGAATLAVSGLLLLYPTRVLYPLGGLAIGAIAAALLLSARPSSEGGSTTGSEARLERAGLFTVLLSAATTLAVYHRNPSGVREWMALPALLSGTIAVAGAVPVILGSARKEATNPFIRAGLIALFTLLAAKIISHQLHGTSHFLYVSLAAVAAFVILRWLDRGRRVGGVGSVEAGLLAGLIIIGLALFAYRELHGFGLGIAGLSAIAVRMAMPQREEENEDRSLVTGALAALLLFTLYRVFTEAVDWPDPGYDPFYNHAGLILGALLPLALSALARGSDRSNTMPVLSRTALAGLCAAAGPLAVWILLGPDAQAAFVIGLGIGVIISMAIGSRPSDSTRLAPLLAAASALSAARFTDRLEPLQLWTRIQRIELLAAVALFVLLWMGATLFLARGRAARSSTVVQA